MREQLIFEHSRAGRSAEAQYPLDAPAASVPENLRRRSAPMLPEVSTATTRVPSRATKALSIGLYLRRSSRSLTMRGRVHVRPESPLTQTTMH